MKPNDINDADFFRWQTIFWVFIAVLVLGALVGLTPWVTFLLRPDWAETFPEAAAQWGDSFGFVNALLSALVFAGVLVTLWMQRRELQLQREEMKLTRQELKATRQEHRRMVETQQESEKRLFLASYMNALESLRQLSQWRMTADPTMDKLATFPVVEGLVVQARVSQSLQILVRDLEPEIRKLHPSLSIVTEEGSHVWRLEELLRVYLNIQSLIETHAVRSDDPEAFEEAVNIARLQLKRLEELRHVFGPGRHAAIDDITANVPDPGTIMLNRHVTGEEATEKRKAYFSGLQRANKHILLFIMSACHQ
ncbi:MAG: hypothetical protein WD049_09195 [Candidatus Paceibacterota bacterium]